MSYSFSGIDHVQLAAPGDSENESRRFYGDILGMEEIPKPINLAKRGGVWFKCGTQQLHIGIQDDFIPAKKAHPAFGVDHLQALRERVIENGIDIMEDESLEGAERFFVNDPFGNRLEFLHWHH